ncbi:hypothetical protein HD554DRAFT_2175611 [Boletus coccyginus]|nr:hypothetical protein HD554DRAFT_2175611 [Boletus coccyginus]
MSDYINGSSPGDPGKPNPNEPVIDTNSYHQHTQVHPLLNGTPCDPFGNDLPLSAPPFPSDYCAQGNHWTPYASCAHFELAEFLYQKVQISTGKIVKDQP